MTTGIKYALLWLPTHWDYETSVRTLLPDMISWRGKISDLIDAPEVTKWRTTLGEFDWRFFDEESRLVLVSTPSQSPAVRDHEADVLRDRLGLAYDAMLLTAPNRPYYGAARCITGEALSTSPVRLKTINGKSDLVHVEQPYYDQRISFAQHFVETERLLKDPYLDRWANLVQLLDRTRKAGMPRTLDVAYHAFCLALTRRSLDYAIPDFVRSVESIIGLSPGMGGKQFAHRSMLLASRLRSHWYVGGRDLQKRVRALYAHRSDCVHGKVPFEMLLSEGTAGEDEAAKFGYLAEALARECLLWALKNQQHFPDFKDRETLEDAWKTGQLPFGRPAPLGRWSLGFQAVRRLLRRLKRIVKARRLF